MIYRVFLGFLTLALAASASAQPNIVLIMADDLGYGDLGSYGQRNIETPHLDRMAREGSRYTSFYAGSPVCAPSRSVLMTGMHAGHTRVRGNFGTKTSRVPLRDEDVTIAEVLQTAGYVSGMTGKWGLGEPGTTGVPNEQGFDEWFGFLNQRNAHDYYPPYLWRNKVKVLYPENSDGKQGRYVHDDFTEWALNFVERQAAARAPFFLYVPYTIPHDLYHPPSVEPYQDKPWSQTEKAYAAMVTRMDRDIGRLDALLRKLDLHENTLVLFCSDNGAAKRFESVFDSSGPLRGRKRDIYEGGIRSPMIIRWPGQVEAGAVEDTPWYAADLLPTLAAAAGIPVENIPATDGVNILPLLLEGEQPALRSRAMYWEFHEGGFSQAVRVGKWKGLRATEEGPVELYDLATDQGEKRDLAAEEPVLAMLMGALMKAMRSPSEEWPVAADFAR